MQRERRRGLVLYSFMKKGMLSGIRENLNEMLVECEDGVIVVTRVASMLLAIKASSDVPFGLLRAKLRALADYLYTPLTIVSSKE